MKETVVLGLSGGVDSAVSALLLKEQYEVHCLYLDTGGDQKGLNDARQIALQLDLPFHVTNIEAELEEHVCKPFVDAYLHGCTPIPCAICNPMVKFPALFHLAEQVGAKYVATGHYARIIQQDGQFCLAKGHPSNDQSYLLSRLTREMLPFILFPLGAYEKKQVRELAENVDFPVSQKPDSMEICFIPDGDYAAWIERRGQFPPPGDFIDQNGVVVGKHKGIHHYTIGQRRGLQLALGHPVFVSSIDALHNQITVSENKDLFMSETRCVSPNWLSISSLQEPKQVEVKLRHTKQVLPAVISMEDDTVLIALSSPARAPTPGQLAVFYEHDIVVGSGFLI